MNKNHKRFQLKRVKELQKTFLALENMQDCEKFLADLCTSTELHAMADRWHIAKELHKETPQCDIVHSEAVGMSTVTRVSNCLKSKIGGYRVMLRLMAIAK